jgi:hypothetical protein
VSDLAITCVQKFVIYFVYIFLYVKMYTISCDPLNFVHCSDNIRYDENYSEMLTLHTFLGSILQNPKGNAPQGLFSGMTFFLRYSLLIFYYIIE